MSASPQDIIDALNDPYGRTPIDEYRVGCVWRKVGLVGVPTCDGRLVVDVVVPSGVPAIGPTPDDDQPIHRRPRTPVWVRLRRTGDLIEALVPAEWPQQNIAILTREDRTSRATGALVVEDGIVSGIGPGQWAWPEDQDWP